MEERRRFNRIDDSVFLSYKPVDDSELDAQVEALKISPGPWRKVQNSMAEIDGRINELLPELDETSPQTTALFRLLNNKIQLLGGAIAGGMEGGESDSQLKPSHKVSLSVGGVSFHGPESVRIHNHLLISLTLFPECYFIQAVGRVLSCRDALPSAPEFNKLIAVDWVYLHEDDRQYMVSHVLKKQAEPTRRTNTSE